LKAVRLRFNEVRFSPQSPRRAPEQFCHDGSGPALEDRRAAAAPSCPLAHVKPSRREIRCDHSCL